MPGVPATTYGYLGPEGTFTEAALRTIPAASHGDPRPYASVGIALDAVRDGEIGAALVPFENSIEGAVPVTLDELARGEPLMITREVLLPVRFALLTPNGRDLDQIQVVATHPHAEAQCREFIRRELPNATVQLTDSTAAAARLAAKGDKGVDAAIAAAVAGTKHRLNVLRDDIGDNAGAVTRFVLVTKPGPVAPPSASDKTSLVAFIRDDHPGALLEILDEFFVRGVNLTRLESRPTGQAIGKYCFSIDAEGHIADARVGEALMGLYRVCADVRFLGSYPRADQVAATVRDGTSNGDFGNAQQWLAGLRRS